VAQHIKEKKGEEERDVCAPMAAVHGNQQSGWPVEELMNGLTLLLLTSARWEPRDQAGRKKPIIPGQPHLFFYFFLDVEFFKR
jgi:hypothetical protein